MWLKRSDYDRLISEAAAGRATLEEKIARVAHLESSFTWLTQHVNTLALQNGQLLHKATGVNIPVPQIERGPATPPGTLGDGQFDSAIHEDMGDPAAKKEGQEIHGKPGVAE